jgi:hypothetical protein
MLGDKGRTAAGADLQDVWCAEDALQQGLQVRLVQLHEILWQRDNVRSWHAGSISDLASLLVS